MTPPRYPWLTVNEFGRASMDISDLDLTMHEGTKVVTQYGDTPELIHRMHITNAINEGYVKLVEDDDA
jgi:hypothetical protein